MLTQQIAIFQRAVKALAKDKGLTLTSVAELVCVSRQAINGWIKGQVPKGGHLLRLCRALETPLDTFFLSEIDSRITVPMHRTRKNAKINDTMQKEATDLARHSNCSSGRPPIPALYKV